MLLQPFERPADLGAVAGRAGTVYLRAMFEKLIDFQAQYRPDDTAIFTPIGSASFANLRDDIIRMAHRLRPIAPAGRRVAVQAASPGLHWVVLLALARLGCVSASLPQVGDRPHAELLSLFSPDLLITDAEPTPAGLEVLQMSTEWVRDTLGATLQPVDAFVFGPDDPVRIVLSSGTTGRPKATLWTRRMVDQRVNIGAFSQLARRRLSVAVGLDTETGFRGPLVAWAIGGAALYPEKGFRWADFLTRSRPDTVVLVPAQLSAVLDALPPDFPPQPSLTLVIISAALTTPLYRRAWARLTPNIYGVYGSTEAGLAAQTSPTMLERGEMASALVSPFGELQIVDEQGRLSPADTVGRVRVRSDEMVQGYVGDEASTREYFNDGWFYPGDLGSLSPKGLLTLCGREAEILEFGGLRIAPSAIEDALLACDGVLDAAAFSTLAPDGVHHPRAAIVCAADFDYDTVKKRAVEAFPSLALQLVVLDVIPRSDRGKIRRDTLQQISLAPPPEDD